MKVPGVLRGLLVVVVGFLALGWSPADDLLELSEREVRRALQHAALGPIPKSSTNRVADDPAAARLGQFLFFDPRLSRNVQVSCSTCHDPKLGFSDGKTLAVGLSQVDRHSMSLWNVAYNRWQFWDGRADSLWAQALQPLEDFREMAGSRVEIVRLLASDADLRKAYERIFGALPEIAALPERASPVSAEPEHDDRKAWSTMSATDRTAVNRAFANVGKSIAAYERRLISRDSPFDVFAQSLGKPGSNANAEGTNGAESFSASAKRGLKLFIGKANCRLCHSGPNFSDGEFHNTGVPPLRGNSPRDSGRYKGGAKVLVDPFNALGDFSDDRQGDGAERLRTFINGPEHWGSFKTPSLRSVALSPPYMHEGQFESLADVVRFYSTLENRVGMGHHQESILVPLNLDEGEIADLVTFLQSLTGTQLDPALMRQPDSPLLDD